MSQRRRGFTLIELLVVIAIIAVRLQGTPDDFRGLMWTDDPGGGTYMTRFAPNGYLDSLNAGINMDNLPTFGSSAVGTSPSSGGSLCDSQPVQGLACYSQGTQGSEYVACAAGIPVASTPSSAMDQSTS